MRLKSILLNMFLGMAVSSSLLSLTALAQSLPADNYNAPSQPAQPAEMIQPQPLQPAQNNGQLDQPKPINNLSEQTKNNQPYNNNLQPMMTRNGGGQGNNMGRGNNQQDDAQQLKNMKREAVGVEREYNTVKKTFDKLEKNGVVISQEVKDNLTNLKSMIDAVKNVATAADLESIDTNEMHNLMGDLRQTQNDLAQKAQQFKDLQRNLRQMEMGVKSFDRQLQSLAKQKVAIPADITDTLNQLKAKIAEIKNAKSADQLDDSIFNDLQELMQNLNDSRQQLNLLSRWPQTIKQVAQQLKNLDKDIMRSKNIADKLAEQGIDLNETYAKYQEVINNLKTVKADAEAKIAAGAVEDAFTALEDGFFDELDKVMQYQRIIQTMGNLSRFNSDFNQGIKQAQNQINTFKKQKIDVSELNGLLAETKVQGATVLGKMKEKPLDEEAVLEELQKMEELRQQFSDKAQELGGDLTGPLPWQQGPQQIQTQNLQMPQNFGQFMNNNQNGPMPMQNSGPSFAPGAGPSY